MSLRIAEARHMRDMSQADLANLMDTSQPQIMRWETGKRDPQTHVIIKMSQILGVSVPWLLGIDDPKPAITPEEKHLLDLWRSTNAQGRAAIMAVAESQRGDSGLRTAQGL